MHLFFNDPRVAYVTRHRRVVRHSLIALVAGGVGVAALGVAIGAAGWEPPRQGSSAPQPAQQGMAMPDPVQDVNLYGVPAAPRPALDLGTPPASMAAPVKPRGADTNPGKAPAKAQVRRVEKAPVPGAAVTSAAAEPTTTGPAATEPPATAEPTREPTPTATLEPTQEPAHEPTAAPTQEPTAWHPGTRRRDIGGSRWPWQQHQGTQGQGQVQGQVQGHDQVPAAVAP